MQCARVRSESHLSSPLRYTTLRCTPLCPPLRDPCNLNRVQRSVLYIYTRTNPSFLKLPPPPCAVRGDGGVRRAVFSSFLFLDRARCAVPLGQLGLWVTRPPRPSPPCSLRLSRALFPFASPPHVHFGSAGAFVGDDTACANARMLAPSMVAAAAAALTGMRATFAMLDQPSAVGPVRSLCAATCCDIDVAEASAIP